MQSYYPNVYGDFSESTVERKVENCKLELNIKKPNISNMNSNSILSPIHFIDLLEMNLIGTYKAVRLFQ